jgi:glycerol uptake facilitator-like aquaporin
MGGVSFYSEIKEWVAELMAIHPAIFIFSLIWVVALFSSLRGVDRRDEVAHLTYATAFMGMAVFMFVLANGPLSGRTNPAATVMFCTLTPLIAALRWGLQRRVSALEFVELKNKANKK